MLEARRLRPRLRVDQLELITRLKLDFGSRLGAHADPVQALGRWLSSVGLHRDLEALGMEGADQLLVHLEQRLATGAYDEPGADVGSRPGCRDGSGQFLRGSEATSPGAVRPDKVGVAEVADRRFAVAFPPAPEIASGETTEDRRAPGLSAFALEGVENLFDGVSHALNCVSGERRTVNGAYGDAGSSLFRVYCSLFTLFSFWYIAGSSSPFSRNPFNLS
jgi:hypothetical protein